MPMVGDSLAQCRVDVDGRFNREWKLEVISHRLFALQQPTERTTLD